jgi:predicted transcriptional regulator
MKHSTEINHRTNGGYTRGEADDKETRYSLTPEGEQLLTEDDDRYSLTPEGERFLNSDQDPQ